MQVAHWSGAERSCTGKGSGARWMGGHVTRVQSRSGRSWCVLHSPFLVILLLLPRVGCRTAIMCSRLQKLVHVFFLVMNTRVGQSDNAEDLVHTIVASFLDYILGGTTIASGFSDLDKWSH